MLETIKNSSLLTKLLYVITLVLFIIWVVPAISSYFSKVSSYEKSNNELKNMVSKQGLEINTKKFSEASFKKDNELNFSKIDITNLGENLYEVTLSVKKENLKNFYSFMETISLRYYVQVQNNLELNAKDDNINIKMTLKAF